MNTKLIIVFVRNPKLGRVKTRLAAGIGAAKALTIYKLLMQHTEAILNPIDTDKIVYYSESISYSDIWDNTIYDKQLQQGSDLGERMENAFKNAFEKGYKKVIIVGSDLWDLRVDHIESAFEQLNHYDVSIGPAHDGGYYLLGTTLFIPELFREKNWGSETVLKDTLVTLESHTVGTLEPLNDIDTIEDLNQHPTLIHQLNTYA